MGGNGDTRSGSESPESGNCAGVGAGESELIGDAAALARTGAIGAGTSGECDASGSFRRVRRRMKKNASPPTVVSPNEASTPSGARPSSEG